MINWKESDKFDEWSNELMGCQEEYGDYIKEKDRQIVMEIYIEEITDKFIECLDESIGVDRDLINEEHFLILDRMLGEGFSDTPYEEIDEKEVEALVQNIGSYLGSNIIYNLGGEWRFREEILHNSIFFGSKSIECFPFHRVAKRVLKGNAFSLDKFYEEILIKLDAISE